MEQALVALLLAGAWMPVQSQTSAAAPANSLSERFEAGTLIPIRFLAGLEAGHDSVGTPVIVQTLAALVVQGCVAVPAFTELSGRVTRSKGGGWFGTRGRLVLEFDSLRIRGTRWVGVNAALDSLEYAQSGTFDSAGHLSGLHPSLVHRGFGLMPLAAAGAAPAAVVPAALVAGWSLLRRGARPVIVSGEAGVVRLRSPLIIEAPAPCELAATSPALTSLPSVPRFEPNTTSRSGHAGDPINLILFGTGSDVDSAFARASWVVPLAHSTRNTAGEVAAAVFNRSEVRAPVSTQFFEGHPQDLAFERPSASVRIRHHVRFWLLDSASVTWVGAANQDVGLIVSPGRLSATHRISPEVDRERDLIVRELEATGCADLVTFDSVPGARGAGVNAAGQRFETDGRAAMVYVHRCPAE